MNLTYTGRKGQTIYDICLLTYGNLDKVIQLVQDSELKSLNDEEIAGKKFTFNSDNITDLSFLNKIKNEKIIYSTARNFIGKSFDDSFDFSFN